MHLVAAQTSAKLRLDTTEAAPFWRPVVVVIVEVVVLGVLASVRLLKPGALRADPTLLLALVIAALLQLMILILLLMCDRLVADPRHKPIR